MTSLTLGSEQSAVKSDAWLPVWPAEELTPQQLEEFFKQADPLITARGFDYDVRGETRPDLMRFERLHDMDGLSELTESEAGGKLQMQKHNAMIKKMNAENAQMMAEGIAALAQSRNLLASAITLSMRPKAPLRLDELLSKHELASKPGTYNGTQMWKELKTLRGKRSDFQDQIDHDRALEQLRDRRLEDGCSVQDFSDKINMLKQHHLPYLQRPFKDDAAVAEFFIDLMPAKNDTDGRLLKEKLQDSGNLNSVKAVAECVKIVKKSESIEVRRAAAAAFALQCGLPSAPALAQQRTQSGAQPGLAAGIAKALAAVIGDSSASVTSSQGISLNQLSEALQQAGTSGASKKQAAKLAAAAAKAADAAPASKEDVARMVKEAIAAAAASSNSNSGNYKSRASA